MRREEPDSGSEAHGGVFATTHWSVVLKAAEDLTQGFFAPVGRQHHLGHNSTRFGTSIRRVGPSRLGSRRRLHGFPLHSVSRLSGRSGADGLAQESAAARCHQGRIFEAHGELVKLDRLWQLYWTKGDEPPAKRPGVP